jgi:hypothetical protein
MKIAMGTNGRRFDTREWRSAIMYAGARRRLNWKQIYFSAAPSLAKHYRSAVFQVRFPVWLRGAPAYIIASLLEARGFENCKLKIKSLLL